MGSALLVIWIVGIAPAWIKLYQVGVEGVSSVEVKDRLTCAGASSLFALTWPIWVVVYWVASVRNRFRPSQKQIDERNELIDKTDRLERNLKIGKYAQ